MLLRKAQSNHWQILCSLRTYWRAYKKCVQTNWATMTLYVSTVCYLSQARWRVYANKGLGPSAFTWWPVRWLVISANIGASYCSPRITLNCCIWLLRLETRPCKRGWRTQWRAGSALYLLAKQMDPVNFEKISLSGKHHVRHPERLKQNEKKVLFSVWFESRLPSSGMVEVKLTTEFILFGWFLWHSLWDGNVTQASACHLSGNICFRQVTLDVFKQVSLEHPMTTRVLEWWALL